MFIADIAFASRDLPVEDDEQALEGIERLLSAMRMNGQICGREWPIVTAPGGYQVRVMIPAEDALEERRHNSWVRRALEALLESSLHAPTLVVVGADAEGLVCGCLAPASYILYTYDRLLDMPLHCGDCFAPVPLYRIPPLRNDEYWDIISWQTTYQACDHLRGLVGRSLDEAVRRELFDLTSDLCVQGREICRAIAELTGRPAYYALYRYGAEAEPHEQPWPCPSCGGQWFSARAWHDFSFVCHTCRLISTEASDRG